MSDNEVVRLGLPSFEDRQSLRLRVTQALRASLVSGQMRPGVLYSAPALAQQFGVSSTPVREAMLDLVKEGLVETVPNKGFRVTEVTDRDLDEITHLRELLEVPTVARIAADCDRAAVKALRPRARAIVDAAAKGDLIAYIEADRRFHLDLLTLAGNTHLVHVVADLRARSRLYGLQALVDDGRLAGSAAEHEELLDLLADHDVKGAESLMRRHIHHVRGSWAGNPETPA